MFLKMPSPVCELMMTQVVSRRRY